MINRVAIYDFLVNMVKAKLHFVFDLAANFFNDEF